MCIQYKVSWQATGILDEKQKLNIQDPTDTSFSSSEGPQPFFVIHPIRKQACAAADKWTAQMDSERLDYTRRHINMGSVSRADCEVAAAIMFCFSFFF